MRFDYLPGEFFILSVIEKMIKNYHIFLISLAKIKGIS